MRRPFASRVFATVVAVVAMAVLAWPAASFGATAVDQSQTATNMGTVAFGCAVPSPDEGLAQTFTAGMSGTLDSIALFLGATFNVTTATAEIHSVDATGMPTGKVLGTTRPTSVVGEGAWVTLDLVGPVPVHAGTQYAIVIPCPTVSWWLARDDPYPAGAAWGGEPGAWFSLDLITHAVVDLAFQTTLHGRHGR